jgi:hypothetical protein
MRGKERGKGVALECTEAGVERDAVGHGKMKSFGDYAILTLIFGLAPSGGIHMQFIKGKPPETQYATCPGARAKRQEVALGRRGCEPGHIGALLSLRSSQDQHGLAIQG